MARYRQTFTRYQDKFRGQRYGVYLYTTRVEKGRYGRKEMVPAEEELLEAFKLKFGDDCFV